MPRSLIFGKLGYRSLRALQISTVFFATVFIQEALRYPRAGWTGFAVMMIYAGFDNGTTLLRTYHRFWGMLLGLFSGYILWFVGHLDYRLLLIILPITIFLAYFLAGQAYSVPTIFTVNTSVIGTGYFDTSITLFPVTFFLTDYLMCTVIAFAIIVLFEYFWFSRYNLIKLFIRDTQVDVIRKLSHLINLLHQHSIRRSDWFEACIDYTDSLANMQNLTHNAQFASRTKGVMGDEFSQFLELNASIFVDLKALYTATYTKQYKKYDYNQLLNQVHLDLKKLKQLLREEHNTVLYGELNALTI